MEDLCPPRVDLSDVEDIFRRFSMIYTGAVAVVLEEMGYPHQCMPHPSRG
jgi:hypothetical protein